MATTPTIKVKIYPGGNPADSSTWGAPSDISAYVRYPGSDGGQAISYSGGRQNEAGRVDASRMGLTLDNRDGRFSPANPLGPYYGLLRRGTPIVLSTDVLADSFTRVNSAGSLGPNWTSVGSSWSANGSAALATIASANVLAAAMLTDGAAYNCEGRMTIALDQVPTGANIAVGALSRGSAVTQALMGRVEFTTGGQVDMRIGYRDGGGTISTLDAATSVFTYTANTKVRFRWQCDGATYRAKIWKPANPALPDADEPAAWTVAVSTGVPQYGVLHGMFAWRLASNTNTGVVITVDDFVLESSEFTGYVASWPIDWDMAGGNAWAAIQCSGILRRLQQGQGTLMSPLRRQLAAYKPTAYWPLEDGADAAVFGAATAGTAPATFNTVLPAGDSSMPGALVAPTFTDPNSRIRGGTNKSQTNATGATALLFVKLSSLPASQTVLNSWSGGGRIVFWQFILGAGGTTMAVKGFETDGTATVDTGFFPFTDVDITQWTMMTLDLNWNGTNLAWTLTVSQVGNPLGSFATYTSSLIPTTGPCRIRSFVLGGQDLNGAAWSHIWIGERNVPFTSAPFLLVSSGYAGETAEARMVRLCAEQGVPLRVETNGGTEQLGRQRNGAFLENLQNAEDADGGTLYETGAGLGYRPRSAKYRVAVGKALSKAAGEVAAAPRGLIDDAMVRNQWNISRDQGSMATANDPAHIAAEGLYEDSATLNLYKDDSLPSQASWRVYLGTRPDLRWPDLALDFVRSPQLLSFWRSASWGQRFTAALTQSQVTGSDPDAFLEGWSATLWPHGWQLTANCSPAPPWDIGSVASAAGVPNEIVIDQDDCTVDVGVNSSATSLQVTATRPWSTTITAFNILVGGETMTVTAVSAVFSGTKQTLTVTRGVGGFAKAQTAGTAVVTAKSSTIGL